MSASTAPDSSGARDCPVCSADDPSGLAAAGPDGNCPSCGRKVPVSRDHAEIDLRLLAGVTDRGLRHHRNEDAMALATAAGPNGRVALAVVSDGVSSA
ncbi:MAG: serine/threonine protein phosphatase, partial [Trebonia sp.]